jgi:HEPN domain-containing protein
MKAITNDWLKSAESDLAIIKLIIHDESLTHQVAFHAQQTIEKSLKAIIEEFELGFIKTHSIRTLIGIIAEKTSIVADHELIIMLDQLYIDARYRGEIGLLPCGKPSIAIAIKLQNLALDIFMQCQNILSH